MDAPGEVRHSHELHTRSALLGLLAAALGIRRDEEERLKAPSIVITNFADASGTTRAERGIITVRMPKEGT